MKSAVLKLALFLFTMAGLPSHGAEDGKNDLSWLIEFFSAGIHSANAEYAVLADMPENASPDFYQRTAYSVDYQFAQRQYTYSYSYEYRDSWAELTLQNTIDPPKPEPRFADSRIYPWKVNDGVGIYREAYEKSLPNWFVFDGLDSLFIRQCLVRNPLPPLTGIFFADELKAIKRLRKHGIENPSFPEGLWSCFEFDESGNVVELSRAYLDAFSSKNLSRSKHVESYSVVIRNHAHEIVFVEFLAPAQQPVLIEGITILGADDRRATLFNFEINSLFHKFVPELMADPRQIIADFLVALQKETDKELIRFETEK